MFNWISNDQFEPQVANIKFDLGYEMAEEKALKISEDLFLYVDGNEASLLKVNTNNEVVETVMELNGEIFETIDLEVLPNLTMLEFFKLASRKEDNHEL